MVLKIAYHWTHSCELAIAEQKIRMMLQIIFQEKYSHLTHLISIQSKTCGLFFSKLYIKADHHLVLNWFRFWKKLGKIFLSPQFVNSTGHIPTELCNAVKEKVDWQTIEAVICDSGIVVSSVSYGNKCMLEGKYYEYFLEYFQEIEKIS